MNKQKNQNNTVDPAEIVRKLRDVAWSDYAHSDDLYDDSANLIEQLQRDLVIARQNQSPRQQVGTVEGRPVFKGDLLYVDIRGTCASEWGKPQIASQGASKGQGPVIIFEGGDYHLSKDLVWEPK